MELREQPPPRPLPPPPIALPHNTKQKFNALVAGSKTKRFLDQSWPPEGRVESVLFHVVFHVVFHVLFRALLLGVVPRFFCNVFRGFAARRSTARRRYRYWTRERALRLTFLRALDVTNTATYQASE